MNFDSKKIEVRPATSDDVELISVLAATTFYEAYFEQDTPHDLSGYIVESFQPQSIQEQIADENALFLIAYVDGRAVGYAKLDAGSTDPSITTKNTIELKRLYILERVWGKGVGEAILQQCEQLAAQRGCETIWLGVWQLNERGQRFYQKHGFVKKGTLEFPYGDSVGINDVMEKKIGA
jgi:GNAT superfamily N-acetyltransferase